MLHKVWSLLYNALIMDKVALVLTLLIVAVCAFIVFLRVYFGDPPQGF